MSVKKTIKNFSVFVVHSGNQQRKEHIEKELAKKNLSFEFLLKGNQEDLTPEILKKYFSNTTDELMAEVSPKTSCAYKHILIYEKIIKKKIKQTLIFEDDIVLYKDFLLYLDKILLEIEKRNLSNYLISLERYSLHIVTKPQKEVYLYNRKISRCAGAYLVDYKSAYNILKYIEKNKCYFPIDWMHTALAKKDLINLYWAHPSLAEQNSHNGIFNSLINKKSKKSIMRRISYSYRKYIQVKLISLFSKKNANQP